MQWNSNRNFHSIADLHARSNEHSEPHGNTNQDSVGNTYCVAYIHGDIDGDSDGNQKQHADGDTHSRSDVHGNRSDGDRDANRNFDEDGNRYAHTVLDSNGD